MKRHFFVFVSGLCLAGSAGCAKTEDLAPGPNNWSRLGPCEVAVESARVGKLRGRGMWGDGETEEDLFLVRTRLRIHEDGASIKLSSWQQDGGLSFQSIKLTDDKGTEYKGKVIWGLMTEVAGRLKKETVLKAGDAPVSDLISFEAKAAQADMLFLELPARWFVPFQDAWAYNQDKGKFRFRIPKSFWQNAAPEEKDKEQWPETKRGQWVSRGPFDLCLQEVSIGKVKGRQLLNTFVSQEDVFSVKTLVRYTGEKGPVRVGAWQLEGPILLDAPLLERASFRIHGAHKIGRPRGRPDYL